MRRFGIYRGYRITEALPEKRNELLRLEAWPEEATSCEKGIFWSAVRPSVTLESGVEMVKGMIDRRWAQRKKEEVR